MRDHRLSIAELEAAHSCVVAGCWNDSRDRLLAAVPVLLEITSAALLTYGACDHPERRCRGGTHYRGCSRVSGEEALRAALAKVRP